MVIDRFSMAGGYVDRVWPHFAGIICGLVIFCTGYFVFDVDRQEANTDRTESNSVTAAKIGNFVGMARVAAARALSSDVHSFAAFSPSKVCGKSRVSDKISFASARLATISGEKFKRGGLWSIVADEKGVNSIRSFAEICDALAVLESNGYKSYNDKSVILTDSREALTALSAQGINPSYIGVER